MKEFTSQVGGRYTYIDDILNLQDLSLAITSLFDGCDNFVLNGCQVSGTTLSTGYVYINGKIRYCTGASSISTWPIYICEHNTVEKVSYADSGDKVGRNVYGCAVSSAVPTTTDLLTGAVPQFIKVNADGSAVRFKDAFIGKYALLLDGLYSSQRVNKNVTFGGNVTVEKSIQTNGDIQAFNGNNKTIIGCNVQGDLVVQSTAVGRSMYQMVITNSGAFQFYVGDTLLAAITPSGLIVSTPLTATALSAGNIRCENNQVYNRGTASDDGAIQLNMVGYNGGNTYYRDTIIGDGKGNAILTVSGINHSCKITGTAIVANSNAAALNLCHSTLSKTDAAIQSYINWQDKNGAYMGKIGYASVDDFDLYIANNIGNIRLIGDVYMTGKLYVGGVDVTTLASSSQKDTGWIAMTVKNCGIITQVYVRQVGHVVSIQGQLHTHHSGTIFTLPNTIDPPKYEIGYSHNKSGYWHCIMRGGSRDCVVDYCSGGCSEYIGFLLTYIV